MSTVDYKARYLKSLEDDEERLARRDDPDYRASEADDRRSMSEGANKNALAAALMKSAAQVGTLGGQAADASPVGELSDQLNRNSKGFYDGLAMDEDATERRRERGLKAQALLADRQERRESAAATDQRAKDVLAYKRDKDKTDREREDKRNKVKDAQEWTKIGDARKESEARLAKEKAPSDTALATAGFGKRAQDADAIIAQLEGKGGYDPTSYKRAFRTVSIPGTRIRPGANAQDESYIQAQKEFIAAVLRKESGGAVTPDEFVEYGDIYFPQPGEDKTTVAQKAARRKAMSDTLIAQSGTAAGRVPSHSYTVQTPKPEDGEAVADEGEAPLEEWGDEDLDAELARLKGGK